MSKINVKEILKNHIGGYSVKYSSYIHKAYMAAIKEIIDTVIGKCTENAKMYKEETRVYKNGKYVPPYIEVSERNIDDYQGFEGYNDDPFSVKIDKESILKVKEEMEYD